MTARVFTLTLAAVAAALAAAWLARHDPADGATSERDEQRTRAGTPVVDEWGQESFPASDPPQSW